MLTWFPSYITEPIWCQKDGHIGLLGYTSPKPADLEHMEHNFIDCKVSFQTNYLCQLWKDTFCHQFETV